MHASSQGTIESIDVRATCLGQSHFVSIPSVFATCVDPYRHFTVNFFSRCKNMQKEYERERNWMEIYEKEIRRLPS